MPQNVTDGFPTNAAKAPAGTAGWIRRFLSFRVMLAAGLAAITCLTIHSRFNDPDLWFHLKMGLVVWTTHAIPTTDIFSFTTHNHAWTAHEWLAELSTYAAYRAGGYPGLMASFSVVASLLFVLVNVLCFRRSGSVMAAFLGSLCALFFAVTELSIRPQLLGYVFLVIELILLESAPRNRRWLYLLPPLFAIWVNCHGSYFFGIGVLFAYWLASFFHGRWGLIWAEATDGRQRRHLGIILAASVAALCCNPLGVRLLLYPLDVAFHQSSAIGAVQEWLPPDLQTVRGLALIVVMLGILMLALVRRLELPLRDLLVVAAAFFMALQHVRMLIVFGVVVSPLVAQVLSPLLGKDQRRDNPAANAVFILGFLAAIVWNFPTAAELQTQVAKTSPVAAVDFVRRHKLSGPMVNEYVFGDYLIWALPEEKVFIDGRGDVYDWTGVLQEFGRWATLGEDPALLLNKYGIRLCILSNGTSMTHVLPYLPGWHTVYVDDVAAVFAR